METEVELATDDGQMLHTNIKGRKPRKRSKKWTPGALRLGIGFVVAILITMVVVVAVVKTQPNVPKSTNTIKTKEDTQENDSNAVISTNHVSDNDHESLIKQNVDDITNSEKTVQKRGNARKRTKPVTTATKPTEKDIDTIVDSPLVLKKSVCSLDIGKVAFVQLAGEYGTFIRDDRPLSAVTSSDKNKPHLTATLYGDTIYRLYVQLDCGKQYNRDLSETLCDLTQNIHVWIDYNDNDFDDQESRLFPYSLSSNFISGGTYYLEIHVPYIDGTKTKTGLHQMRVTVTPNQEYQRNCGTVDDHERRDYMVNIIPRPVYTPPPAVTYRHPLCYLTTPKITLVLIAGERGTQIRDDLGLNLLTSDAQNRHHMAVTLHDNTVYLLRIQLDCSWQLNTELFENGCNLAQDVNVWIDANNDGRFEDSEIGAPHRWPVTSYMPEGIYDIQISIPHIDDRYITSGEHRMRIVALPSEHYRKTCGRNDNSETREYMVNIILKTAYIANNDFTTPYTVLSDLVCPQHVGKIILVIMPGERRTQIKDDLLTRDISDYNRNQQAIIVYENTVYLLRLQLDCSGQWSRDSFENNCNLAHTVYVWIDLDEDGQYDPSENVSPFRWPINSYTPKGVYDLQLYIPNAQTSRTKTGSYPMHLVVTLNDQYRRKCGNNGYTETRDYRVTIIPNNKQLDDIRLPYLTLSDNVCSLNNGKIKLVIMAGEHGTQIRDNIRTNTLLNENQNRHHLAVSLYENTVYRIRIQLSCLEDSNRGLSASNCNLAKDVDVSIDLNNNGVYEASESRTPQRWPLLSSMPLGIYDWEIRIPAINEQYTTIGSHQMRIIVTPSDEYVKKCGNIDSTETRYYTVNVISKSRHPEVEYGYVFQPTVPPYIDSNGKYCSAGNLACSDNNNAISLVALSGEQSTQIYDDMKKCNSRNNYHDRSDLSVTLFDNGAYILQIEVHCGNQWNNYGDSSLYETNCNGIHYIDMWIDFNGDGRFDENAERVHSSNWPDDGHRTSKHEISIVTPVVDDRKFLEGYHRMRIILASDGGNLKPCYNTGYGEVRDYTVQFIRNSLQ